MKKDSRICRYFDLKVSCATLTNNSIDPDCDLKTVPLKILIEKFIEHSLKTVSQSLRNAGEQAFYVADIGFDDTGKYGIILINKADKAAADQAIDNDSGSVMRVVKKADDESYAYSSHLVIDLSVGKDQKTYKCMLEESVSIGSKVVERLLRGMSKELAKLESDLYQIEDPARIYDAEKKEFRKKKIRMRFEMFGTPSDDFLNEIASGEILDLELYTKSSNLKFFDSSSNFKTIRKAVKVSIMHGNVLDKAKFSLLTAAAKKENMDTLKIHFKASDDEKYTVNVDTDTKSLLNEKRFVKKTTISGFSPPLATATIEIDDRIVKSMIKRF